MGNPSSSQKNDQPRMQSAARAFDVALGVSYCGFILATMLLAWMTPLLGDDYYGLMIVRGRSFSQWLIFWYTQHYGRITGLVPGYFVLQNRVLFAILVGLTLPVLAFLLYSVALGRLATTGHDLRAVAFLTVALWFALPIAADINWRSAWRDEALPAVLMLAAIFPYSSWVRRGAPAMRPRRRVTAALSMLLLVAAAADSHESVLVVLTVLAALFVYETLRNSTVRDIPEYLWWGLVGLTIGAFTLLAAPGNFVRAHEEGGLHLSLGAHLHTSLALASQELLVWLMPAYPWLLCLLFASVVLNLEQPERSLRTQRFRAVSAWLVAAALANLPFLAFPQVAAAAGERTIIFTTLLLFVAATSLLAPESVTHVRDRLPRVATTLILTLLVLMSVGDVLLNTWVARAMDDEIGIRAELVARQSARGVHQIALPPLAHHGSRAILWGEVTANPDDWLNIATARYYGVESVVTTTSSLTP